MKSSPDGSAENFSELKFDFELRSARLGGAAFCYKIFVKMSGGPVCETGRRVHHAPPVFAHSFANYNPDGGIFSCRQGDVSVSPGGEIKFSELNIYGQTAPV